METAHSKKNTHKKEEFRTAGSGGYPLRSERRGGIDAWISLTQLTIHLPGWPPVRFDSLKLDSPLRSSQILLSVEMHGETVRHYSHSVSKTTAPKLEIGRAHV